MGDICGPVQGWQRGQDHICSLVFNEGREAVPFHPSMVSIPKYGVCSSSVPFLDCKPFGERELCKPLFVEMQYMNTGILHLLDGLGTRALSKSESH